MLKPTDARTASTFTKALALSASVAAITLAAGCGAGSRAYGRTRR